MSAMMVGAEVTGMKARLFVLLHSQDERGGRPQPDLSLKEGEGYRGGGALVGVGHDHLGYLAAHADGVVGAPVFGEDLGGVGEV